MDSKSGTFRVKSKKTKKIIIRIEDNKNYYVVRNARCACSRYTLTLSLVLINE